MIGVAGVLLIAMGMVQGGGSCSAAYNNIRDGVAHDSIVFNGGSPLTRSEVCATITDRHNSQNSAFLDNLDISSGECESALSSPQQYTPVRQNKWAGKHCWTSGGVETLGNADWEDISTQPPPSVYTQKVTFQSTPPLSGFNRVTDENNVEGDGVDSFRGCYVGYVIALRGPDECIVKVTETDAFIECLSGEKRTSAGYFNNYAQYTVKPPGSTCT